MMARGVPTRTNPERTAVHRRRVRVEFDRAGKRGLTTAELNDKLAAWMTVTEIHNVVRYFARADVRVIQAGEHVGFGFRWYLIQTEDA